MAYIKGVSGDPVGPVRTPGFRAYDRVAMPLLGRPDGELVGDAPPLRRMMPHIMPTRAGSTVYFDQRLDVTRTLPWVAERGITLFELMLAAYVRTLAARPDMHRFVVGRRLYQRRHLELSFAVKKRFEDGAGITTVKVRFDPEDGIDDVSRRVKEAVGVGRGDSATTSEKEMGLLTRLPRSLTRALVSAQRGLDYFNLLPEALLRDDPLYASMFLANLGSVGLQAAYHHLYEYGTIPLFGVIGRIHEAPVAVDGRIEARKVVDVRYTYDERIADGWYAARSLELFEGWVEDPDTLGQPEAPAQGRFVEDRPSG